MSTPFDDAIVSVFLADYIGVDASGKLNILGQGFQITGLQPSGTTAPQFVATTIDFPARYAGSSASISLELIDVTDQSVVKVPSPAGGAPEALRAAQLVQLQRSNVAVPGFVVPEIPCRAQIVMGFPNGLPLIPGKQYEWRVSVDGKRRKGWVARFSVLAPAPPPVVGGPAGAADIPSVIGIEDEQNDDEVTD